MQPSCRVTETSVTLSRRLNELAAIRASLLCGNSQHDKPTNRCLDHRSEPSDNLSELLLIVRILHALGLHTLTMSQEDQEMDQSASPGADRQPWKQWLSADGDLQDEIVKSCLDWKPNPSNPHSKPWQGRNGWMAKYSETVESKAGYIKSGNGQG